MIGRRARWGVGALAVAIPLVPIVVGATISSSSGGARPSAGLKFKSAPPPTVARPPAHRSGTLVALVKRPTTMRRAPGGGFLARLPTKTEFGSPEALWVVSQHGPWLGVISPLAGNGKVGWIPRSVTTLGRVTWELKVSLGARRLTVLDNGHPLRHYKVAIGRPDAPTPTGRFAVTDRLSTGDPSGPYGCCVLALSAKSPHAIQGWSGGNRIAIHSTPETSSIGLAVSHGCVRVTLPDGQWLLAHIPLGTPTLISS